MPLEINSDLLVQEVVTRNLAQYSEDRGYSVSFTDNGFQLFLNYSGMTDYERMCKVLDTAFDLKGQKVRTRIILDRPVLDQIIAAVELTEFCSHQGEYNLLRYMLAHGTRGDVTDVLYISRLMKEDTRVKTAESLGISVRGLFTWTHDHRD